ncbi:hypothetical protein AXF42_Ash010632 [Apostasia shenzhenica]|uniref:Non-structural maintenance of chromosomes element 1 homolog n=1 Tax=Apostasia shenzhenica TaxID=1088818 RepID=A0A2I0A6L7_9ASPA|nr:hypothetical protein AXF42_Ash010632 [Apostasia shenzhenica]
MAELGWRHHALIQTLLSRGPLKEQEFHTVFAGVTGKNPASHLQLFNECLLKINKVLDFVQLELRACMNQYDGNIYYGVVNNVSDEQSKIGTKFSVPQIAFYKAVIEAIIQDERNQGCITSIEALNVRLESQVEDGHALQEKQSRVPTAFRSFSISQKEKTLNDLVREQWLCSTSDGKIGLGVRSFLDLRSWFRDNDVLSCDVCNEAAIKAEQCSKDGCPIRMHSYCLKKKFYSRKAGRVCPGCRTQWDCSEYVVELEEPTEMPPQSNQVTEGPMTRNRRSSKSESVAAGDCNPAPKKRLKTCKAEIADDELLKLIPAHPAGMRSRRSSRN